MCSLAAGKEQRPEISHARATRCLNAREKKILQWQKKKSFSASCHSLNPFKHGIP
jgi:hypothetical protein